LERTSSAASGGRARRGAPDAHRPLTPGDGPRVLGARRRAAPMRDGGTDPLRRGGEGQYLPPCRKGPATTAARLPDEGAGPLGAVIAVAQRKDTQPDGLPQMERSTTRCFEAEASMIFPWPA